jgi:DNA-binding MarR family transcriptional regulator
MVDLRTILQDHKSRQKNEESELLDLNQETVQELDATSSEIPDLFFDEILVHYKLTRVEILVLMYLYRRVWCRPNLYQKYGISPLLSHTEQAKAMNVPIEEVFSALRKIESYGFISTIRSGQYFVRKYFLKPFDDKFGQTYDDFEL